VRKYPHAARAAPTNARTTSDELTGGGARPPIVLAARSATWRLVKLAGQARTSGNRPPFRTASHQRPRLTQPALAAAPRILSGLVLHLTLAGLAPSKPNKANAWAIAGPEYLRPCSIPLGTTNTTALQATQRYRRHDTPSIVGSPSGSSGPSIWRPRRPCPCRRKRPPVGRLALPQQGQRAGRTFATEGISAIQSLTPRLLRTIRLVLRSFSSSGIYPGPDGDGVRAPVPITFSETRPIRVSGPLLAGRALHHVFFPAPSHQPDGHPISIPAHPHQEAASPRPPFWLPARICGLSGRSGRTADAAAA
jgi:hypothetical protein